MSLHYIYRHIRPDLNQPFYIGMGTSKNPDSLIDSIKYKRAYDKKSRNPIWVKIAKNISYSHEVDVIYESEDKNEILKKEIEFIKLYGRKDLNTGSLSNLTDGGEGGLNQSPDSIKRAIKKNRENGCYEKCAKFLAQRNREHGNSWKGVKRPETYTSNKQTFVYSNKDGRFIGSYYSRADCKEKLNLSKSINLLSKIGRTSYSGYLFFNEDKGASVPIMVSKQYKKVYKFCPKTGDMKESFLSSKDVCSITGAGSNVFCMVIQQKRLFRGYYWSFLESINISEYRGSRIISPKGVRKTTCAKCDGEKTGKSINWSYCNKCNSGRYKKVLK